MFTIEILKCHEQKIGVTPHFAGKKPAENKITRGWWNVPRRHSLEAYSGFLHLPTANGSKFWPNAPSAIIYMAVTVFYGFSQYSQGSGFSQSKTEKTQGIQRRFLDFLYQKTWIFSTSSKRKPQLHRSLGGQSLPCHPQHWTSILMLTPLISWQVAVENSPFSIIYFDDLPNLSQKSLKMVIFQFANCYSSHYQRLCLKRPIRSNHTQVQTGTQMRPSIFLCDIPHLMGEDTQLSTDEKKWWGVQQTTR